METKYTITLDGAELERIATIIVQSNEQETENLLYIIDNATLCNI